MISKRFSSQLAEEAGGCFGVCPFSKRGKVLCFSSGDFPLDPAASWNAFERRRPFSL